jgi:hypothetical protein
MVRISDLLRGGGTTLPLTQRLDALLYRFRTRSIQKGASIVIPPQDRHPLATSALPDAPVVPEPAPRDPGPARVAAAALLRRLADRLDTEPRVVTA